MDGVLEVAFGLCVCKVACSIFYLPSLTQSNSAVSFCCCYLLVFTDLLITVFLCFLSFFEPLLPDETPTADVIALRFLLLLGDIYGGVFILITPLIGAETVIRQLQHHHVIPWNRLSAYGREVTIEREKKVKEEEEEVSSDSGKDEGCHALSYLCCLSVWVIIAFTMRWKWKEEDMWVTTCLHTAGSLVWCLPNLLGPILCALIWCLCVGLLILFLLLLNIVLQKLCRTEAAQKGYDHWEDLNCSLMASNHHGDDDIVFPEGKGHKWGRTKNGVPFLLVPEKHVNLQLRSQSGRRRLGFSSPEARVILEWMSLLGLLVLPLNLSVNVLLIRNVDTMLMQCIDFVTRGAQTPPHTEIQV